MVSIRAFGGYTVSPEWLNRVPSPAYDSLSTAQRQAFRANNPWSYLNVTRAPEDELPGGATDNASVVAVAREVLDGLLAGGAFCQVEEAAIYLYRLRDGDHSQTAIVAEGRVDEYISGEIRIHEQIRQARAELLAEHMIAVGHVSSPIALSFGSDADVGALIAEGEQTEPILDWDDGSLHQTVWRVEPGLADRLRDALAERPAYIIDGHHRAAASAAVVARDDAPLNSDHMLVALFPDDALRLLGFNRWVRDVDHDEVASVLAALEAKYDVTVCGGDVDPEPGSVAVFAMGRWYMVHLGELRDAGPLDALDPVRLQREILGPMLGVEDPGRDPRLVTISGDQPLTDLEQTVLSDGGIVFVVARLTMADLFAVADLGQTMPPKSTYFVPKVRAGIFLRPLNDDGTA